MSIISKLADLIFGDTIQTLQIENDAMRILQGKMGNYMVALKQDLEERDERLRRIAACETPGANATVKRMARIAREATGCDDVSIHTESNP